jgi:hypothetical protein
MSETNIITQYTVSQERTLRSAERVRNYRQQLAWIRTIEPRAPERDWIVITLNQLIENINSEGGHISVNMNSDNYRRYLEWCDLENKQ